MRYAEWQVQLYDLDEIVVGMWRYLIKVSSEEIRRLPLIFDHVDDLRVPQEARWLIGHWLNKGTPRPCKTPAKWMREWQGRQLGCVYWGEAVRERIARQVQLIRHWKIYLCSWENIPNQTATWFVDSAYNNAAGEKYKHGPKGIDYKALAEWCKTRKGQVIACENEGATWLPFRPFGAFKGQRSKTSEEVVWTNSDECLMLPPLEPSPQAAPVALSRPQENASDLPTVVPVSPGDDERAKPFNDLAAAGAADLPRERPGVFDPPLLLLPRKQTVVINSEFVSWARTYAGPKFHSVLCDPGYGYHFMAAEWDDPKHMTKSQMHSYLPPGQRMTTVQENIVFQQACKEWGEAMLPHLYPGALVMMFAGPRMFEWLATGMQLAGFEHWDTFMWLHAQGFPKAMDIGKQVAKLTGEQPIAEIPNPAYEFMPTSGQTSTGWKGVIPATKQIYANAWQGYKTPALKPAWEAILCFRAPRQGMTYAELALKFGTGCLNIDGGRIGTKTISTHNAPAGSFAGGELGRGSDINSYNEHSGRYPSNLVLDEEAAVLLDKQSGNSVSGTQRQPRGTGGIWSGVSNRPCGPQYGDRGGASRFFYVAKASSRERNAGCEDLRNDHPCVKPLALCRHLAALLLPPASVSPRRLFVPFLGSGSEMIGAEQAGWDEIVGVEQNAHFCEIANLRIKYWRRAPASPGRTDAA
jgi:site-specific DNA-methyltransferase (adenine-specific)